MVLISSPKLAFFLLELVLISVSVCVIFSLFWPWTVSFLELSVLVADLIAFFLINVAAESGVIGLECFDPEDKLEDGLVAEDLSASCLDSEDVFVNG